MSKARIRTDTRGLATGVTQSLAVGITALLIIGLFATANTYLQNQQRTAAESELETIGNQLANQLMRVDRLGQKGGDVSIVVSQVDKVVGQTYTVTLEDGTECDSPGSPGGPNSCLVLSLTQYDIVERVPIQNSTAVAVAAVASGQFELSSTTHGGATRTTITDLDMNARVGVGRHVDSYASGSQLNLTNQKAIVRFSVWPGTPTVADTIHFDGGESRDFDGNITDYNWDLDGDGNYTDASGETITHSFATPGEHTVGLQVTDNQGGTAETNKSVYVSGLVYDRTQTSLLGSGTQRGVAFTLRNEWSQSIELTHLLVDPTRDQSVSSLHNPGGAEIQTDSGNTFVSYRTGGRNILDGGVVADLDENSQTNGWVSATGQNPTLSPGETIRFELRYFDDSLNQGDVKISTRYMIKGVPWTTKFQALTGVQSPPGGSTGPSGPYVWETAADWDNAISESAVQHENWFFYTDDEVILDATSGAMQGTIITDWQTGGTISSSAVLEYSAEIDSQLNTGISVTVQSDHNNDGIVDETSNPVSLSNGTGTETVTGLSGPASKYRLKIDLRRDQYWDPTPSLKTVKLSN